MQILEDEEDGVRGALALQPRLPGAAHGVAHEHRVLAGGAQRLVVAIGEGRADQLAQERGDVPRLRRGRAAA